MTREEPLVRAARHLMPRLAGAEVIDSATCPRGGRVCLPLASDSGYQTYRLRIRRGARVRPVMQVHLRGGSNPRVLGIVRVEP